MIPSSRLSLSCLAAALATLVTNVAAAPWPAWRRPEGTGVTTETDLPLEWSATENVA